MTAALLDRLTHRCHIFEMNGESYRFRDFAQDAVLAELFWHGGIDQHGPVWNQVIIILTGIPDEAVDRVGGVRIVTPDGRLLYERVPAGTGG